MFLLVFLVGVVLLGVLILRRRSFATVAEIPGPLSASFSSAWQIWHIIKGDIDRCTTELHRELGPFVRIGHDEVSVCHPEAVRKILLNPLSKSKWYRVMALPDHRFQTPMSETDPKRHAQRSRNLAAGFALSHVIKSEPYVDGCIRLLKNRLAQFAKSHEQVNPDEWFNYMAFDILGEIMFSQKFGFLEAGKDLGGSIANSQDLALYVSLAGYFQKLHRLTLGNPILSDKKLMPNQHIFDTTLRAIENRQKNREVRKDVLSLWLKQREQNPGEFTEKDLYGCVNMTVGAGADTVSASMQTFFYHLIRHPQHLARVRKEILDAGLTDEVISFADASQLSFLQACLREAWRLFPPVPFGLKRVVPEDGVTIGDRHFRAGTILSVNPRVIHYSTELFGEDAAVYNPERWLGPGAKDLEKHFIAFGAGFNSCQGRNIAQLEILKATATLVRDFDFTQVNPAQDWSYNVRFTATPYDWPCFVKNIRNGSEA